MRYLPFLLLVCCSRSLAQSPASELDAAHRDSRGLSGELASQTRYLTIYAIPAEQRESYRKLLDYWPNGLSRETDIVKPRKVNETLYAIALDDYGWKAETWEKLIEVPEPWFHVRIKVPAGVKSPKVYWRGGSGFAPGWYHQEHAKEQIVDVPAPWLNASKAAELSIRLNTAVPIVRADWFIFQSGDEQGRKVGYYQWLGLKSAKDLEDLAGLDRSKERAVKKEVAGIVAESGVGLNSRQIFRIPTTGGAWWETRDTVATTGDKNALRQLDKDFQKQVDALEVYYDLPNGLFGFALLDGKNTLQATAPDTIASDSASTNRNHAVRVGVSCIRCHVEGLRPIDDWSRKVFTRANEIGLGSPDRDVYRRLKQLHLGPLQKHLREDIARYAATLNEVTGLKPQEFAKLFREQWGAYESAPLGLAEIARECGVDQKVLSEKLLAYLKRSGSVDTVLAAVIAGVPLRREHFEELLPILMPILGEIP